MAPTKTKKKSAAEQEAADFIAGLLAEQGITPDEIPQTVHGEPTQEHEMDDSPQRILFRAQGVLRSLEFPLEERLVRTCKNEGCGAYYTTNYRAVAYCSMLCAEQDLKKYFGLAWKPHARIKKERWEVLTEPTMIPMQALQAMKLIVTQVESQLGRPIDFEPELFARGQKQLSASESPLEQKSEELPSSVSELLQVELPPLDKKIAPVQLEPSSEVPDDLDSWLFS
jgi:hypothetical protein